MVAGGARLWKRDTEERESEKERKNKKEKKMIKKEYLNEVLKKNRIFYGRDVIKWCTICYKIGFWDGKC